MSYSKKLAFKDARGEALSEFAVNDTNVLQSDVLVTYSPVVITENRRPGVIRLTKQLVEQLSKFPIDMQGVPIDVLIKIAHAIKKDEGKSVLAEMNNKELVVQEPNESKLIVPD